MSHFLELGYIRVLIDENMLQFSDLARFPLDRGISPDRKTLQVGDTRYLNFCPNFIGCAFLAEIAPNVIDDGPMPCMCFAA